jgi:hypothetical protein
MLQPASQQAMLNLAKNMNALLCFPTVYASYPIHSKRLHEAGILQHIHFIVIRTHLLSQELMLQRLLGTNTCIRVEFQASFQKPYRE